MHSCLRFLKSGYHAQCVLSVLHMRFSTNTGFEVWEPFAGFLAPSVHRPPSSVEPRSPTHPRSGPGHADSFLRLGCQALILQEVSIIFVFPLVGTT